MALMTSLRCVALAIAILAQQGTVFGQDMAPSQEKSIELFDRYKDEIWAAVDDPSGYRSRMMQLPQGVPEAVAAWWLIAEVENGGFRQYFENSYGGMIDEAIRGFEMTDRSDYATAARIAAARFGPDVPLDRMVRWKRLEVIERDDPDCWKEAEQIFGSVRGEQFLAYNLRSEKLAARLLAGN